MTNLSGFDNIEKGLLGLFSFSSLEKDFAKSLTE
jgi:hypothetical protein